MNTSLLPSRFIVEYWQRPGGWEWACRYRTQNNWLFRGPVRETESKVRNDINKLIDTLFIPGSCVVQRVTYLVQ